MLRTAMPAITKKRALSLRLTDRLTFAWTGPADLQNPILDLNVMRDVRRFRVKTAGRQDLQVRGLERLAVTGGVHSGDDRHLARVGMGMRRDLRECFGQDLASALLLDEQRDRHRR